MAVSLLLCGLLSISTARAFVSPPSSSASASAPSSRGSTDITDRNRIRQTPTRLDVLPSDLKIIFSDVDGALIHYPKHVDLHDDDDDEHEIGKQLDEENRILALPPSATGMRGIVSSRTLAACRDLRSSCRRGGGKKKKACTTTKLVLVSGMRTSTLLGRLPYLPRADAYCTEAGGRIFYPTEIDACCPGRLRREEERDGAANGDDDGGSPFPFRSATPLPFSGARADEDLTPFGLREDVEWRRRMEMPRAAGRDGYPGNEVHSDRCDALEGNGGNEEEEEEEEECPVHYDNPSGLPKSSEEIPIELRKDGALWEFARKLRREEGLVLDTKSYSTCFRVNAKHQKTREEEEEGTGGGRDKFRALLDGEIRLPEGMAKSINLGCIDVYPVSSGKLNCCQYIADRWGADMATESVCICDDDNDIEMALGCSHAYIPALTSTSVVETMAKHPNRFTQTYRPGEGVTSTLATEAALRAIQDGVASTLANEAALEMAEDGAVGESQSAVAAAAARNESG